MKKKLIIGLLLFTMATVPSEACSDSLIQDGDRHFAQWPVSHFNEYVAEKRLAEEEASEEAEGCCGCSIPVNYLGEFTAYAYCGCSSCCGQANQLTASGTIPEEGRTIAVDTSIIPLGSKLLVEYEDGSLQEFTAEDTGSAIVGNKLDVYMESHKEALEYGCKKVKVYLVREER